MEFRPKKQSSDDPHQSRTSPSISPSQDGLNEEGLEDLEISSRRRKSSTDDQKRPTASSRPSLNRSTSGSSNGNRKRTSYQSVTSRGRSRPSMTRKRSSQSQQTPESSKNRPSIRSPQPSKVESTSTNETRKLNKTQSAETTTGSNTTKESSRRISSFGLPSASSWQSDESHADSPALPTGTTSSSTPSSLVIDKNFRKKFVETQKKFQSSTDPTNSTFRRTGSIVRFADEIDLIDPFRKQPDQSSSSHQRTPSESQSGHPQSLLRHDSTGSVAAISDDESDNNSETTTIALPRVTSQLSLGIAHLKRSQNTPRAGPDNSVNNEPAARLTSPSLRMEQTESTREDMTTRPSEEDETGKLLAMGWKDGVTRAGGVNLPSPLVVKGDIQDGGSGNAAFEGVEESIL